MFLKRASYCLASDLGDDASLHSVFCKEADRPSRVAGRRVRTGDGDQCALLLRVEHALRLGAWVVRQRVLKSPFEIAPADAAHFAGVAANCLADITHRAALIEQLKHASASPATARVLAIAFLREHGPLGSAQSQSWKAFCICHVSL